MKLNELKQLLAGHPGRAFNVLLPGGQCVPQAFHITEVGYVKKTFIDCGGQVHTVETCQLQVWLGPDEDHRLATEKLGQILNLSAKVLPHEYLALEVEYEDTVISQYPVREARVDETGVTLVLDHKHTDCLAKELCFTPAGSCGPQGCC